MPESKLEKRAGIILQRLAEAFPQARLELDFDSPLQLLVATILAAQCTDVRVNQVTQTLFRKYPQPQDYLEVPEEELQEDIRSTGFYRQKAGKLRQTMNALIERHEGEVPADMEELTALPGVGRKTANVILGNCFGIPGIVVDTHMTRLGQRLGLTAEKNPVKIESALGGLLPEKDWIRFSLRMVLHGRYVCKARRPLCDKCSLLDQCPYFQEVVLPGREGG
ncbi:MAG: endonuclease III [Acidobacteriota bacterium]